VVVDVATTATTYARATADTAEVLDEVTAELS